MKPTPLPIETKLWEFTQQLKELTACAVLYHSYKTIVNDPDFKKLSKEINSTTKTTLEAYEKKQIKEYEKLLGKVLELYIENKGNRSAVISKLEIAGRTWKLFCSNFLKNEDNKKEWYNVGTHYINEIIKYLQKEKINE
ncbi:hypothetical protein ACX1NB_01190 [Mycoplasma sp. HF14]